MWQILHAFFSKFSKLTNSGISLNWPIIDEVTTRNTTAYFLAHCVYGRHVCTRRAGPSGRAVVHDVETVVIEWTHQIRAVLKKDSAQPLLEGLNPTPYVEVEFWNAKAHNLSSIFEQVTLLFLFDVLVLQHFESYTCMHLPAQRRLGCFSQISSRSSLSFVGILSLSVRYMICLSISVFASNNIIRCFLQGCCP